MKPSEVNAAAVVRCGWAGRLVRVPSWLAPLRPAALADAALSCGRLPLLQGTRRLGGWTRPRLRRCPALASQQRALRPCTAATALCAWMDLRRGRRPGTC